MRCVARIVTDPRPVIGRNRFLAGSCRRKLDVDNGTNTSAGGRRMQHCWRLPCADASGGKVLSLLLALPLAPLYAHPTQTSTGSATVSPPPALPALATPPPAGHGIYRPQTPPAQIATQGLFRRPRTLFRPGLA